MRKFSYSIDNSISRSTIGREKHFKLTSETNVKCNMYTYVTSLDIYYKFHSIAINTSKCYGILNFQRYDFAYIFESFHFIAFVLLYH